MKKTLDIYGVLFVYYTITKGDIMKNLTTKNTTRNTNLWTNRRKKLSGLTTTKVIKGNALVSYLMYQFDYTRKQAEMMESRMPGGFEVQVIY